MTDKNKSNGDYNFNDPLTCQVCSNLMSLYFNDRLIPILKLKILKHIRSCVACYNEYNEYSKKHLGTCFNLDDEVDIIATKANIKDTVIKLREKKKEIETKFNNADFETSKSKDFTKDYYTQAALDYDLVVLLSLQSFSDFVNEYNKAVDVGDVDYKPFYQFMAKKMCQKIDHLEECFGKKVFTDKLHTKSKENSKGIKFTINKKDK